MTRREVRTHLFIPSGLTIGKTACGLDATPCENHPSEANRINGSRIDITTISARVTCKRCKASDSTPPIDAEAEAITRGLRAMRHTLRKRPVAGL